MAIDTDNKYNISIWQGSTFGLAITVKDAAGANLNLANNSAYMQIRPSYDSGTVTETLSSSNGEITITAGTGKLDLTLSAARTANIAVDLTNGKPPKSVYVYDLELTDSNGQVSKVIWGDFTVYGEVSR